MDHKDHLNLLRPANLSSGGLWADFGAGSGAFSLALRELIGPEASIYAVDKDRGALADLERSHRTRFNSTDNLFLLALDFSRPLSLPLLDGILMANSLHFFRDPLKLLRHAAAFLKSKGSLLLVEYNVDSGNAWVPYPLSFETFCGLAAGAGFSEPRLLARKPSRFLNEFYAALTYKQPH